MSDDLLSYVGPPELHDATLVKFQAEEDRVIVEILGHDQSTIKITFIGVAEFQEQCAEGMVLYALAESKTPRAERQFEFLNWDDESDCFCTITAQAFQVRFCKESGHG